MYKMRHLIIACLLFALIGAPWIVNNYPIQFQYITDAIVNVAGQIAAVIVHKPKTVAGLQSKYNISATRGTDKIRILLVPGHEPDYGGAEYRGLKERDMNIELANNLAEILKNNSKYEVFVTRDDKSWLPELSDYFKNSWGDIVEWKNLYKEEYQGLQSIIGNNSTKPKVYHNSAPNNVALRLYGITKWANEKDMDIVIHIHFNDNPGHTPNSPGKYGGFAIYVPEEQFVNSTTTKTIVESIFQRLSKYNAISDLKGESEGVIEESELIAIGVYNTADAPSMLIEYGYIYEPQFADKNTRDLAIKDFAFQTYLGIQDFFGSGNDYSLAYDTLMLPYRWQREIKINDGPSKDILALQTALQSKGLYPPTSRNKNDCPRTGTFGSCTKAALIEFQSKNGIKDENGIVGPKTLEVLNKEYGNKVI